MSIVLENISYVYMPKTPFERRALDDVSLEIPSGKVTAIAGHTGSGKSTLIQMLNGLLKPYSGRVIVDGVDIAGKTKESKAAKRKVGMVFQYPEHQLFEESVAMDIAFGPKNLGLDDEAVQQRIREAMNFVGLDYDAFHERSPFQLSGGQMRRVAIAGVLALQPEYLVLDEPTAGLDPKGREELMGRFMGLHKKQGTTIILISHSMDDIARYADNVVILNDGKLALQGTPQQVFASQEIIEASGLELPEVTAIMQKLKSSGLELKGEAYTMDKAVELIAAAVRRKGKC